MALVLETGYTCLNKNGEELCGDKVEQFSDGEYTTIVLADGMGSGVKANILATLTSKILCTMIANKIDIEECVETIIQTLPICKERQVAYSTFSVVHVNNNGEGFLIEFDNPEAFLITNSKCQKLHRESICVLGKTVFKTELKLQKNDFIILLSDGVIHAGVGKLLNFGWQRAEIEKFLNENLHEGMTARGIACLLASACNDLYVDVPGDDTSVVGIKFRDEVVVNLMVGPPIDKNMDNFYVSQFVNGADKKVVCGGTSSQIVARYLNKSLITSLDFVDKEVPPIGYIDGIDLITEGVLTLRKLMQLAEKYISENDLSPKYSKKKDGASLLANILFEEASAINFYVGQSVNVAHQGLPIDTTMKIKLVEKIARMLERMGKKVVVNYD